MKHHSLEARLAILAAGLFFAVLLAIGYVQMTGQQSTVIEERMAKYQTLSNALASAYAPMVQENDRTLYQGLVTKLLKADKDFSYIIIADSTQRSLFVYTPILSLNDCTALEGKPVSQVVRALDLSGKKRGDEYDKLNMPAIVGHGKSGSITAGISKLAINQASEDVADRVLVIFAAAFLVGVLGVMLLAKTIIRPIECLISAAHAVRCGNLDVKVQVGTKDEIGELATTFNLMVDSLKDSHQRLTERANSDSLTELYNHRHFQERLASELSRAARYKHPLSVIMADIDHFKALNDIHGHPFGDHVLQEVAKVLMNESRSADIPARYGGEEFAIILPETTLDQAAAIAERMREKVERHCFVDNVGICAPVSISLGAAQYPIHGASYEKLLLAADLAMYQSKAMGRNLVTKFSSHMLNSESRVCDATNPYKLSLLLHADDTATLEAIAGAIDAKGRRTPGLFKAITRDCLLLGESMGLSKKALNQLRLASLLYDIGKLSISESILTKPGSLTGEEQHIVKSHPALGYAIVQKSPSLNPILPAILHHHECWDGTGYPNGLRAADIPVPARIIALVDAFHAMTSHRAFCRASTEDSAIQELRRCAGRQFDPEMVEAFVAIVNSQAQRIEGEAA